MTAVAILFCPRQTDEFTLFPFQNLWVLFVLVMHFFFRSFPVTALIAFTFYKNASWSCAATQSIFYMILHLIL